MIAARRSDVTDLNARARGRMAAAGRLTGPTLHTGDGQAFQAGDAVMCLRNDRRLGVVNGTRGTITQLDSHAHTITVRTDRDDTVTLTGDYLDAGHLTHGYAITGHRPKG
jgi:ATP-dependent exoDNAse (exonuclease V) alpha subunit